MALRVLLADESSTIKKVFQLALQDFAVDVRPVNVGIDVVTVAQNFKPDIIFADVMLQKKSGYEVAADLKQNPALNGIPVVLMWSGFIELDEDKFQASHANAQLEKPFDVTALRKLVTDLVPRTQNQRLSQFLAFPKLPDIQEGPPAAPNAAAAASGSTAATSGAGHAPPPLTARQAVKSPDEEFEQVSIPKMKGAQNEKYRLNLKPEELEPQHVPVEYQESVEPIDMSDEDEPFTVRAPAMTKPAASTRTATPAAPVAARSAAPTSTSTKAAPVQQFVEIEMDSGDLDADEMAALNAIQAPAMTGSAAGSTGPIAAPSLSAEQLEKIIREQSAEVIESVVWKVVPDLAATIIERELNRLLKERESQPY